MPKGSKQIRSILMSGAGLLAFVVPAAAQSEPVAAGNNPQGSNSGSAEIIVTAQRKSERLIDTPQSITALTSADLAKLNAVKFVDYANTVPGLQFVTQGVGRTQINIRGVSTGTDVSSTVGIYVDDVPYGSSTIFAVGNQLSLDAGLFDLDRVEVLRGPQGTLYGASSIGGLIKYVTREPSLTEFGGLAQGGVAGTRDGDLGYNGNLVVNIPVVTDKIAIRASGFYSRDGGYVDNTLTGEKNVDRAKVYGGRVDVLLKPTEDLSVRLTGFGQNIRRDGALYSDYDRLSGASVKGSLDQSHPLQEPFDQNFRLVSGTVSYDFGSTKLTSITSYQTSKTSVTQDLSAIYVPFFIGVFPTLSGVATDTRINTKRFTQELRLSTQIGRAFEITGGGFYTREKSRYEQQLPLFDAALAPIDFNLFTTEIPTTYREYAFFGDITWHITDKLDLTGGARYAHNTIRYQQIASGLLGASQPADKSSDGVVTYLANARYHFTPNVMAYARFATGYRPGGPNTAVRDPSGALLNPTSFKSDTLDSYEGGIKAETRDRTFAVDLAGYYIDWKNIQLGTAAGGVAQYVNAGGAHIRGAEVTLTARPSAGFTATGNFAYNDSNLTEASAALGAAKGERLPNTAHFTGTVTAEYVLNASSLKPTIGASVRYTGKRTASFDASAGFPQYHLPDYVSTDLRAGLTFGPVEAQVYVHNLFDVRGQLSATTLLASAGGPAQVAILQPRTVGISATTRF